jgi:PPP family 3-phenylpropionic acid transporter
MARSGNAAMRQQTPFYVPLLAKQTTNMAPLGRALHARLAGFYLAYFAVIGALVPYWAVYLRGRGFDERDIGALMALLSITRVVAPQVWGWLADRGASRIRIIRIGAFLAGAMFAGLLLPGGFLWVAAVMLLFSFFWNAVLPQFEVVTLGHLGAASHRYTQVRVWGSVGFILSVLTLGPFIEARGADWLPQFLLVLFALAWLFSFVTPEPPQQPAPAKALPMRDALRRPAVWVLLTAALLTQMGHGAYYSFYTLYLSDAGHGKGLIGAFWALGVGAEIVLFLFMHRILARHSPWHVMQVALMLTALRWLLIAGGVQEPAVLALAQVLHAASFGAMHAASIHLVQQLFPGRLQGRGQALYSGLGMGLGNALGSWLSGLYYAAAGGVALFWAAGGLGLISAAVVHGYLRHRHDH